jgi:hypothetical protein
MARDALDGTTTLGQYDGRKPEPPHDLACADDEPRCASCGDYGAEPEGHGPGEHICQRCAAQMSARLQELGAAPQVGAPVPPAVCAHCDECVVCGERTTTVDANGEPYCGCDEENRRPVPPAVCIDGHNHKCCEYGRLHDALPYSSACGPALMDQAARRIAELEAGEMRRLRRAVNSSCSCGGKGPDDEGACGACRVWHAIRAMGESDKGASDG